MALDLLAGLPENEAQKLRAIAEQNPKSALAKHINSTRKRRAGRPADLLCNCIIVWDWVEARRGLKIGISAHCRELWKLRDKSIVGRKIKWETLRDMYYRGRDACKADPSLADYAKQLASHRPVQGEARIPLFFNPRSDGWLESEAIDTWVRGGPSA